MNQISDIVERLRANKSPLCIEAADEIDRLRSIVTPAKARERYAALDRSRAEIEQKCSDGIAMREAGMSFKDIATKVGWSESYTRNKLAFTKLQRNGKNIRRLHLAGRSPEEIAAILELKLSDVMYWYPVID